MMRTAQEWVVNRKLIMVIKGKQQCLDQFQVPVCDWLHSIQKRELYHCHGRVVETYPLSDNGIFFAYHTLKVSWRDVTIFRVVRVNATGNGNIRVFATASIPLEKYHDAG